jgi:hypothetical protein
MADDSAARVAALYRIDHMHDRRGYTRNIARLAADAGVTACRVVSAARPRGILIALAGSRAAVARWAASMRTQNVDVDARGSPCRERLLVELTAVVVPAATMPSWATTAPEFAAIDVEAGGDAALRDLLVGSWAAPAWWEAVVSTPRKRLR